LLELGSQSFLVPVPKHFDVLEHRVSQAEQKQGQATERDAKRKGDDNQKNTMNFVENNSAENSDADNQQTSNKEHDRSRIRSARDSSNVKHVQVMNSKSEDHSDNNRQADRDEGQKDAIQNRKH
jgi:hypothetical protein